MCNLFVQRVSWTKRHQEVTMQSGLQFLVIHLYKKINNIVIVETNWLLLPGTPLLNVFYWPVSIHRILCCLILHSQTQHWWWREQFNVKFPLKFGNICLGYFVKYLCIPNLHLDYFFHPRYITPLMPSSSSSSSFHPSFFREKVCLWWLVLFWIWNFESSHFSRMSSFKHE
jgi:hypothetical protein